MVMVDNNIDITTTEGLLSVFRRRERELFEELREHAEANDIPWAELMTIRERFLECKEQVKRLTGLL